MPVTPDDKYHVDSCTEAMTASVAGILIDRTQLDWDTTLRQVFPEATMHRNLGAVTLA